MTRTNLLRPARMIAAAMVAAGCASALAQPTTAPASAPTTIPAQPQGDIRAFTITPMAPPRAALRHQLRVDPADQIDGNAATTYLQAILLLPDQAHIDALETVGDAAKTDAEFAEAAKTQLPWLDTSMPPMLETATRRDRCDWDTPLRQDGFSTLLPYLNHMRKISRLLHAKTRLALARGEVDQALRLVQAHSTLAERIDDGIAVVVQNLVGIGVQASCMEDVQRIIERPDGPNLFWALRQYPVPFGNLQDTIETERAMMMNVFPALKKPRTGEPITAEDWKLLIRQIAMYGEGMQTGRFPSEQEIAQRGDRLTEDLASGAAAFLTLADARHYYAETRNIPPEQVAKIEPLRVIATYVLETYEQDSDAMYKWFALPYPQMLPGVSAAQARFTAEREAVSPVIKLFRAFAPSLSRTGIANARVDRTIAAFACVEAIRAYAGEHDGALPPSLDAVKATPPPLNPVDGQPFDYVLNPDGSATLSDAGELVESPLRYELRVRK